MEIQSTNASTPSPEKLQSSRTVDSERVASGSGGSLKSSLETQKLALKLIRSSGLNIDVKA